MLQITQPPPFMFCADCSFCDTSPIWPPSKVGSLNCAGSWLCSRQHYLQKSHFVLLSNLAFLRQGGARYPEPSHYPRAWGMIRGFEGTLSPLSPPAPDSLTPETYKSSRVIWLLSSIPPQIFVSLWCIYSIMHIYSPISVFLLIFMMIGRERLDQWVTMIPPWLASRITVSIATGKLRDKSIKWTTYISNIKFVKWN